MFKNLGVLGVAITIFAVGLVFVAQHAEAGKNSVVSSGAAVSVSSVVSPPVRDELLLVGTVITEAYAGGNGNGSYDADWFEVTNASSSALNITGWKWDDSSNAFANAVALRGVTSIPAGKSAVFMESDAAGVNDAAKIAAFCTAWFGTATPPPGFLIGTYGGSGIGLGNGGDAVNLFDSMGVPITGITIGPATAAITFDNAAGLTAVAALSVAGTNGARVAGGETGSPGTIVNLPASVDLSTYVRIGRYDLPEPTRTVPPANSLLAQEVSGVTYNWDTNTLFVVGDAGTSIVQVSKTGQLIDSMTLALGGSPQGSEFYDPEGITYVGGGKFVITEERDRRVVQFTYAPGTTLTRAAAQTVGLGTFVQNIGLEGISYDPQTSGFILVKESAPLGIFQTSVDFAAGTATNGSPSTVNSTNLFDPALLGMIDIADVFALSNIPSMSGPNSGRLLVLSHESAKIVNVDRSGSISSTLTIVSDPGNPLSVVAQQHEGLTMDQNGVLYVVSENGGGDFDHPQLWVYAPSSGTNQAPTAIALNNQVNTVVENTSTTLRIKVADIAITDDGLGTNGVSVTGADASFFEADLTGLYIKSGTVLDFETKSSYSITVNVDDATVGNTPDASTSFNLTVSDVVNENPISSIIISEVAAWSSGNSPVAADWFEITNTGVAPVNLTGWRVDDSSASFASALTLNGVTSIAPGESVIFLESASPATIATTFRNNWFGANPPANLQIGSYTGGGIGLSTGGDEVNIYNAAGILQSKVVFGASPAGPTFATFNNAAGLNNATISQLSAVGVNGAFMAVNSAAEIGSPGTVGLLFISEVAPWSSGNSPVAADWFEVTNGTAFPVDITGWKVDDSSGSPLAALPLTGITVINAGESVIFFETANPASTTATFRNTWFGANAPAGLRFGSYTGGGIGLSTGGDAVNLYNSTGVVQASVLFGASPAGPVYPTFDNAAGLNNVTISQLSAVGVNGAFSAPNPTAGSTEIGSPGKVVGSGPAPSPTPTPTPTPPPTPVPVPTGITVSEVAAWSSGNSPVAADWFELTNRGTTAVDITGWRVDDSSAAFANALVLNGVTSIAPGESVIFLESTSPAIAATFRTTWFGVNPPANLQIGTYTGAGIGLSTGGDAVNIYNAAGVLQANVVFGASPAGPSFATFDNAAGLNNATISLLSVVGVNGAFIASGDPNEIGSPGRIAGTPTPTPTPTPRPLTANNDTYGTAFGTALTVPAATGLLANDIGTGIGVIDNTNSASGQVTVNADGSFNFVPANGFSGPVTFSYTISDVVQTFRMNNPPLGTFGGVSIDGSAFGSSIAPVPGSTDEYWGLTDRGPNVDNLNNGTKVEPIPTFNPAIGRFRLQNGTAVLQGSPVLLKGPNNEPYNGQVNTEASTGETITDINGNILPPSPFGYDPEGLVALPDGTFWVSDEYGPFITKFDATGRQIQRLSPFNGSLPRELSRRRPNRGMEGLTITPDGTRLVGMMQSPLINDITQGQTNTTTILRIVVYTIANGQVREYLYLLDNPATNAGAVSEITALSNTTFLVEERDGLFPPAGFKRIFQIDISGATDVGPLASVAGATYDSTKGLLIGANTLERQVVAQNTATATTTLAAAGITPVSKTLKLDLVAMVNSLSPTSRIFAHDKVEGLAILDGGNRLVIANDSDFGVAGITNTTPPFQLESKNVAARGGQQDFGEFLIIDLTRPIQTSTATVTINVGPPLTTVAFNSATFRDDESQSASVTVTRSGMTTGTSTVTVGTATGGTAVGGAACAAGVDYQITSQTVTFAPGVTSQSVSIPLCGDVSADSNETVNLSLTNANSLTGIGMQGTAVLTINDTANQFLNTAPISITQGTSASAYPAPIVVSGATGNVFRMRVTLFDLYHALPDNVEVLLVSPNGAKYVLMGDVGGPAPITENGHVTLTLGDFYAGVLSDGGPLVTGGFKPTTCGTTPMVNFPAPAPDGPYVEPGCTVARPNAQTLYGAFGGATANGTWNLFIRDDAGAARPMAPGVVLGEVRGGWGIELLPSTAAGVEVSGRVMTPDGRGLRNATVTITDSKGVQRTATTGSFGSYSFEDVEAGSSFVMGVTSKRYRFSSRVINVTDSLTNVDFVGME